VSLGGGGTTYFALTPALAYTTSRAFTEVPFCRPASTSGWSTGLPSNTAPPERPGLMTT
jgi:hypothetical protein